MRASLFVSIVFHLLLLSAALLNFSSGETLKSTQPVTVELLSPSQFSQLKAGKPESPLDAAAAHGAVPDKMPETLPTSAELSPPAKPSRTQAALPPPKPKAAPPSEPVTADKPSAAQAESAKPLTEKPEPKVEAQPRAGTAPGKRAEVPKRPEPRAANQPDRDKRPEQKPASRTSPDQIADLLDKPTPNRTGQAEFDPKQIAALLNRDPDAGAPPRQDAPRAPWRKPSSLQDQAVGAAAEEEPRRDVSGAAEGQGARMSASDIDALRAQISRCWAPPVGGLGGDAIIVKLHIVLNEDGTLSRAPDVVNNHASPFFPPAADSAVRAVFQCQPYRMPPGSYSQWRDMLLNFDPSRMYGG
jgi:hypothetical protein